MVTFFIRRLLFSIPVLIGILVITFVLARVIPGDPCTAALGEKANPKVCEAFNARIGLDKPIYVQFVIYVGGFVQGDFGTSYRFGRSVVELLAERLPTTVELGLAALTFAVIIGVPLGIISAYRRNSAIDVGTMLGANIGVSMPVFWLGLMLAYLFAVILKETPFALPPSGRLTAGYNPDPYYIRWGLAVSQDAATPLMVFISRFNIVNAILTLNGTQFVDALRHLVLPALAVGTIPLAIIARMTRSSVLETLGEDYVRTARSKGLSEFVVVTHHAVRNAMLPVVTVIGLNFGILISGAVLTETIFGLTGVGRTLVDSITARDYSVVQGFTVFIAIGFVVINLLTDAMYAYLDPRIRLS